MDSKRRSQLSHDDLIRELHNMPVNLKQWTDVIAEDDCPEAEGRRYREIVTIFARDKVKGEAWGNIFCDEPCSACEQRQVECVRKGTGTGCEECPRARQKCPRSQRFEAQQASKWLGITASVSWARYQTWGKPRRDSVADRKTDGKDNKRKISDSIGMEIGMGKTQEPVSKKKKTISNSTSPNAIPSTSKLISALHEDPMSTPRTPSPSPQVTMDRPAGAWKASLAAKSAQAYEQLNKLRHQIKELEHSKEVAESALTSKIRALEEANKVLRRKEKDVRKELELEHHIRTKCESELKGLKAHTRDFMNEVTSVETDLASVVDETSDNFQSHLQKRLRHASLQYARKRRELQG